VKLLDTDVKVIADWAPHFANYTSEQKRLVTLAHEKLKEWKHKRDNGKW